MGRSARFALTAALILMPSFLVLAAVETARAQIVINEIYPDPAGVDDPLERVEIYNAGATPIDVTGWGIHDAASIDGSPPLRCRLPEDFDTALCSASPIINPGEFRVVKATLVAAWLNQGGDDVYLCSNRTIPAVVVHQVTYPSATGHIDEVWAALPNGTSNFAWRAKSLCATNGTTGDVTSPGTVSDLVVGPGAFPGEIRLTWTAPGDDGATGTASAYEIKVANAAITTPGFASAVDLERWINKPLPRPGGSPETLFVYGMSPDTTYYFALRALDEVPNSGGVSNSPGSAPLGGALLNPDLGYTAYFGNLHSHSNYSDGASTPTAAYNYARNTAPTPLDFLAVTDHNHTGAGMSLPNYHQGLSEAAAANNDGDFVAIYGQEWGLVPTGHVNIFEAPVLFGWDAGNYDVFVGETDYLGLYAAALANPPSGYPVLMELCHPAVDDYSNFAFNADALAAVHLMCLVNGPAQSSAVDESDIGNTGFDDAFQEALEKGFRVSPTADQDNHNANWGASAESRTGVLATAKTKSAFLTALAARRAYASQDHNTEVEFTAEGRPMGAAFTVPQGVRIVARVTDPDVGESPATIELFRGITGVSTATRIAFNINSPEFHWREREGFAPGTEAHYYLKIRMADNQSIWTGPIYVTYDPSSPTAVGDAPLDGSRLSVRPNPSPGQVTAEFTLSGSESRATLAVYDLSGRRVRTLLDRPMTAGRHRIEWDGQGEDGRPARTGVYYLRLQTRAATAVQKVMLLR